MQFLSEYVAGASVDDGEAEAEEEETQQSRAPAFQVIGTVSEESDEERPHVLECSVSTITSAKVANNTELRAWFI